MSSNNILQEEITPLGNRKISLEILGNKAGYLDIAKNKNLRVPDSFILTNDLLEMVISEKITLVEIFKFIQTLPLSSNISIRSAFSIEDSHNKSFAGLFDSFLNIKRNDFWFFYLSLLENLSRYNSFLNPPNKTQVSFKY